MSEIRHRIGVGVAVVSMGQLLLSRRRKEGIGYGMLALPGGKPDEEDGALMATAIREVLEETGLSLVQERIWPLAFHDRESEADPFVSVYYYADTFHGTLQDIENDKHGPWAWYPLDDLPQDIWLPPHVVRGIQQMESFIIEQGI